MKKNAPRDGIQSPSVFHLTALSFLMSFMASRVIVGYSRKAFCCNIEKTKLVDAREKRLKIQRNSKSIFIIFREFIFSNVLIPYPRCKANHIETNRIVKIIFSRTKG